MPELQVWVAERERDALKAGSGGEHEPGGDVAGVGGEGGGQGGLSLRQALAAAGADAQIPGQITHPRSAALGGLPDLAVRHGFAYTYDHGGHCERECE